MSVDHRVGALGIDPRMTAEAQGLVEDRYRRLNEHAAWQVLEKMRPHIGGGAWSRAEKALFEVAFIQHVSDAISTARIDATDYARRTLMANIAANAGWTVEIDRAEVEASKAQGMPRVRYELGRVLQLIGEQIR